MGLSAEEKAQLDALTKKANEPDEDDNYEIEIYDENGRGARVPYRKGRGWLQKHFGIDLDPSPEGDSGDDGDENDEGKRTRSPARKGGKDAGNGEGDPGKQGYWRKR